MEVEIRPEPDDVEREAILTALRESREDRESPYGSAWRSAASDELRGDGDGA